MSNFVKNILTPVIGFGIGALLWGQSVFVGEVKLHNGFYTPFAYILGALYFGILGSVSLVMFSGDKKKILRLVGFGIVTWIAAFTLPRIWEYPISIYGGFVLGFLSGPLSKYSDYLGLRPSMGLPIFWFEFLLIGLIVATIYAFILKGNLKKTIICGALGFALASIVSPIFGNIIGNAFNSLFISYLATFSLIGIIFGFALTWGLRDNIEIKT